MKTRIRRAAIASAAAILLAGCRPVLSDHAVIVHKAGSATSPLAVSGDAFGNPAAASYAEITRVGGPPIVISSQSAEVEAWEDNFLMIALSSAIDPVSVRVHTAQGWSETSATIKEYDVDFFATHPPLTGVDSAHDLTSDAAGQVWVNFEFHNELAYWSPVEQAVHKLDTYPVPPVGIFPGTVATAGEEVITDSHGRVWFSESGANHARLLAFDTTTYEVQLYNLPGNRNGVYGVAWDDGRQRVWFEEQNINLGDGVYRPARLVSFDPDNIPSDDYDFNWTTTATCDIPGGMTAGTCSNAAYQPCNTVADCVLAEQICPPGVVDDSNCYHRYDIPGEILRPAMLTVHPDGSIWYANYYFGDELGRLDPATGTVKKFDLSSPPSGCVFGSPWDVRIAPNGDVWATEYGSTKLARVPLASQDDDCDQLVDPTGQTTCEYQINPVCFGNTTHPLYRSPACMNPCVEEFLLPGAWVKNPDNSWTHRFTVLSLDLADDGSVVTEQGYLLPNRKFVFWPRLMDFFPSPSDTGMCTKLGLANAAHLASGGVVWGADYCGKRIMRLTPEP